MTEVMHLVLSRLPKLRGLPAAQWAPRHRTIVLLVWAHVPVLLIWGLLRGYPVWHATSDVIVIAALAALADHKKFSQTARSCIGAVALVTCSAMVVHVAGGAVAAHFHFFVVLPIIGLYGQWKPFLISVGYIVVHHLAFALLVPRPSSRGTRTWATRSRARASTPGSSWPRSSPWSPRGSSPRTRTTCSTPATRSSTPARASWTPPWPSWRRAGCAAASRWRP